MAKFQIGFEGGTYEWDDQSLMLSEAREIKKWLKVSPPEWLKMLAQDDADAETALICILRRRDGEKDLRFADVEGDLKTLTFTLLDEEAAEGDDGGDPTQDVE